MVCWLRRRIMRRMLCSIYTNIFAFHQQRSWSTIIYWLSERKNATYHAIEYQLSKKVLYSWSVVCTRRYFCAFFLCVGSCIKRRQLISFYLCQGCVTVAYNLNPFLHRMNEWLNSCNCDSNFWVCGWNPMVLPFKWTPPPPSNIFTWYYLFQVQSSNFWVCGWNRVCDHSN